MSSRLRRALAAGATAALALGLAACSSPSSDAEGGSDEPVRFGVALPDTGNSAQYGEYFRQGLDLAASELNADGGIDGRDVELVYEDTQADPAQAPQVAQKFIDDASILAVLGDFGTPATSAASQLYQDAGLVQFAFSASGPDVTDPGDFVFATWVSQEFEAPRLAEFAAETGTDAAVFYHDTDWGQETYGFFQQGEQEYGLNEVYATAYDPESTDFRPLLLAAQKTDPEVIVLISYAADGALITSQARELGIDTPIVGISSIYNQQFIELAGDAAEGVRTLSYFTPENDDPAVQQFISDFEAATGEPTPSDYAIRAYDALYAVAQGAERADELTRQGLRDALDDGEPFTSILYGEYTLDDTRRVSDAEQFPLVIADGAFTIQ
ncbi:ABC transporter substrate-binding protein [Leucobacter allii]|uniref:ABC transporter substrate-binding protein n=1 Tax=Leucobacter allii TaxID=2932247 RepID=A0ABY4FJF3_9MICO|nr:ABC transporter substrate-binding protein [Leucobacter allii]UOQ56653.1 ABC transporter substrate-binding protein [Leucobacter allii]UOR01087.1 ABC transporter substrate-binding protein [Leucobacter allii]